MVGVPAERLHCNWSGKGSLRSSGPFEECIQRLSESDANHQEEPVNKEPREALSSSATLGPASCGSVLAFSGPPTLIY